jgi:3-hydroxybutyryl-CoA dehydrogenase
MLPIVLKKEQHGYIMNALSVPFLNAALGLWGKGVADPITIDKDWMNSTGSPMGPFMSMDVIGLRTVWAIFSSHADTPEQKAIADKLKAMIDAGHYGVEAGEGFYTYPHPAYEDPNFLKE